MRSQKGMSGIRFRPMSDIPLFYFSSISMKRWAATEIGMD